MSEWPRSLRLVLLLAQTPPLILAGYWGLNIVQNADCRTSTYAECDPLMGLASVFAFLVYVPVVWLICTGGAAAVWSAVSYLRTWWQRR